ncbi:MAG: ECF-type sigma factor [Rubricoccaceae bacterium]|nr:ECF-type sigma factor [Rubricoccaceae bacterium]
MADPRPTPDRPDSPDPSGEVTRLLEDLQRGEPISEALFQRVYDELHQLARHHRARWKGNETLNTTAILHEAYLKLVGGKGTYHGKKHFMAVASKAMRHLLISYAERQASQKRGGGQPDLPLDEALILPEQESEELLALEEALKRFEQIDPRAAEVVEIRFFGGLEAEEAAEVLGVSRRTVSRDWAAAKAWLYAELSESPGRNLMDTNDD